MGAFETIELALKLRDEATSKLEKQRIVWARLKLAAVAAVAAFAAFVAQGVRFNAQVEKATIQFGAFFRNAEQAEAHVRSLTDFAARTPFQLPGILQASRMLLTFAADAAFGADTLRIVGDAAAGVSAPIEEVSTWFGRMYTAIQAGRPMGEALQRLQELGLLSGVARTKMEDLSKAGADQEQVMAVLRDEWEKHDGAMVRLSGTTEGLESTFTDLVAQVAGATAAMIGADSAYKKFLETSNQVLTGTLDMMNGVRDLDAEIVLLKQDIAAVNPDFGGPWTLDNLARLEAELSDLQNLRFWEQYNTDLEAAASSAEDVVPVVVELTAEEKKLAEAAAEAAEESRVLAAILDARLASSMERVQASALAAGSGIGAIQIPTAELIGVLESRPLEGVDLLGIGSGAERATRQLQAAGADGGTLLTAALDESTSAWARAGGLSGMFTGITGAIGAFAAGGWKGGLTSMLNTAASYLPPGMAQVAQASLAAISAVWSAMKRPSEEEIQARKTFEGMHEIAVEELGGIAEYQDQVATLMADGWDRTLAETVAGFEHWGAEAGIAHDYVVSKYAEYQSAVKAGDAERMAAIEDEVNAWKAAGAEKIRLAEEAAEAAIAAQERVNNAAVSGFERAKQAGETAYAEIMDIRNEYVRAEIEGDEDKLKELVDNHGEWITSHGAALNNAVENQIDANREILQDEGEKYARIAAFEAAMALGANATRDERIAAAMAAKEAAIESWDVAMDAVTASDEAATDAMKEDWTGPAGVQQETEAASTAAQDAWAAGATEIQRVSGVMATGLKGDLVGIRDAARSRFSEIVSAAQDAANAIEFESIWPDMTREMANDMARMADESIGSIGRVVNAAERAQAAVRSFHITSNVDIEAEKRKDIERARARVNDPNLTAESREWLIEQFNKNQGYENLGEPRQEGGPVTGGRSYITGELGPEVLSMPRGSSGYVTANRDIIDYDRLAAAIAANPPVIAPDQVAAASLRESPAERAWRGWQ